MTLWGSQKSLGIVLVGRTLLELQGVVGVGCILVCARSLVYRLEEQGPRAGIEVFNLHIAAGLENLIVGRDRDIAYCSNPGRILNKADLDRTLALVLLNNLTGCRALELELELVAAGVQIGR